MDQVVFRNLMLILSNLQMGNAFFVLISYPIPKILELLIMLML
jgi:hypothetical protein